MLRPTSTICADESGSAASMPCLIRRNAVVHVDVVEGLAHGAVEAALRRRAGAQSIPLRR